MHFHMKSHSEAQDGFYRKWHKSASVSSNAWVTQLPSQTLSMQGEINEMLKIKLDLFMWMKYRERTFVL